MLYYSYMEDNMEILVLLMFYIMSMFIHPYIAFLVFVVLCGLCEETRKGIQEDKEDYRKFREAGHSRIKSVWLTILN